MHRYIVVFFFFTAVAAQTANPTPPVPPIVRISSGLVEGTFNYSRLTNNTFYSFRGIPFAEPPLGKLRFQPAVRKTPWNHTLQAKMDGPICWQWYGGSEDCLILNVFTPSLPTPRQRSRPLAVMVYVHGGGFHRGNAHSNYYGPDFLVDKNVVVVVFQYRLNIFGFLNTMHPKSPGNIGLKDMAFALKWVQENIHAFNGDRSRVTIFGHSAGTAAVQFLVQARVCRGLFHRAIFQSGSTLNNWAFEYYPLDIYRRLGNLLNLDTSNVTAFIETLQTYDAEKLMHVAYNETFLDNRGRMIRSRWVPSLEIESPEAMMTEKSYILLQQNRINRVPIMTGWVSTEGLTFIDADNPNLNYTLPYLDQNRLLLVPKALNLWNDSKTASMVLSEIENYFFKGVPITNLTAFINLESDENYVRGIRKTIEFLRRNNNMYFYVFDYKDPNNTAFPLRAHFQGVGHIAELQYIWNTGLPESDAQRQIRNKITTLFTNFAKIANPTPVVDPLFNNVKWPVVRRSEEEPLQYFYIAEHCKIGQNPWSQNRAFWERIFRTYGRQPFYIY